jgi:hypothetical protein
VQFWEYLFTEDQRLNLADADQPDQAERLYGVLQGMAGPDAELPAVSALDWRWNLLALRTLARYLKKKRLKRGRNECLPTEQALAIQREYLRGMCVVPIPIAKPSAVVILPTSEDGVPLVPGRPCGTAANAFRVFWQGTFFNMLGGEDRPVCRRCGKSTAGTTPKGRKQRRTLCDRCYWKNWREKQPKDAMRKRWRDAKVEQKKNLTQEQHHVT